MCAFPHVLSLACRLEPCNSEHTQSDASDRRHCAGCWERKVAHWCILQKPCGRAKTYQKREIQFPRLKLADSTCLAHLACAGERTGVYASEKRLRGRIASNLHSGVCEINRRGMEVVIRSPFTPTCNIGRPARMGQKASRQNRLFFRRTRTLPRSHHRHNIKFGGTGAAWWTSRCSGGFFRRHRTP